MGALARRGDMISGGAHCHGHSHGPILTPGRITEGSDKVFAEGKPAACAGDKGHSPLCCAGIGKIVIQESQRKVFIQGRPAASTGTPTVHCGMAPGSVRTGSKKVFVP